MVGGTGWGIRSLDLGYVKTYSTHR